MNKFLMVIFVAVLNMNSHAQNGKLIAQSTHTLADTTVVSLSKFITDAKNIIENVNFSRITYISDGLKVNGYMAVPKKTGKYPCVIYNRGGNRETGKLKEEQVMRFLGAVANWGYIVVGSQYRGNDGSEGKEEFGGKDINDVLNLIPLLKNIPNADTSRIGMYGWSRGGLMTYLTLAETNQIKAAIVGSGMSDSFETISKRPEMEKNVYSQLIPDFAIKREEELKARSPILWTDKLCKSTPVLIMAGSADWRVNPEQPLAMAQKLYEIKHPFRFVMFEGGDHGLTNYYTEVNDNVRSFLDTYVRDGQKWPSLQPHGN